MKTVARITTGAALALVSLFVAAPAFAAEEEGGHGHGTLGAATELSTAGAPVDVIPGLIVGAVLLVIVLGVAGLASAPFAKKQA